MHLPNATNHPDAPPNLEPALLKLFGKTGDDICQDESGARYFNVSFEDTCLPSNTITVAKLDQSMKLFLRWHVDRRNVLAGLSAILGFMQHEDSVGGATRFDVDTEENAVIVRSLAHLGVRYKPDTDGEAASPHGKKRVGEASFPLGLLVLASAVDTAHAGEDACTSQQAIDDNLHHRILGIDRLQAAGLAGLLQLASMVIPIEHTTYLARSTLVLEYVALMLDNIIPLTDTAAKVALGINNSERSKFFKDCEFTLVIGGEVR